MLAENRIILGTDTLRYRRISSCSPSGEPNSPCPSGELCGDDNGKLGSLFIGDKRNKHKTRVFNAFKIVFVFFNK